MNVVGGILDKKGKDNKVANGVLFGNKESEW